MSKTRLVFDGIGDCRDCNELNATLTFEYDDEEIAHPAHYIKVIIAHNAVATGSILVTVLQLRTLLKVLQ